MECIGNVIAIGPLDKYRGRGVHAPGLKPRPRLWNRSPGPVLRIIISAITRKNVRPKDN